MSDDKEQPPENPGQRFVIDAAAFLAGFILGAMVLNNVGLGIVFGLIFSGGYEAARKRGR
ncbi:MAG: hypothetical protein HRU11_08600 [Parvularculaceae bacterium]|nr:hypothetical protein [Parvularculaceae bacterium]